MEFLVGQLSISLYDVISYVHDYYSRAFAFLAIISLFLANV